MKTECSFCGLENPRQKNGECLNCGAKVIDKESADIISESREQEIQEGLKRLSL